MSEQRKRARVAYFGCIDEAGHFFAGVGFGYHHEPTADFPFGSGVDGVFAPVGVNEDQTVAALHHVHGWTVLSMWDRSIDKRFKSNANFFVEGTHELRAAWTLSAMNFPQIVDRLEAYKAYRATFHVERVLPDEVVAGLDPDIRDVVVRLNEFGFKTCDSGDGRSKPPAWFESGDALPYPHVLAQVLPTAIVSESERMARVLGPEWRVEASYVPGESAILAASKMEGRS